MKIIPVNHLYRMPNLFFPGNFTFKRGKAKSQIDWCFTNKFALEYITNFDIDKNCPDISDHFPLTINVTIQTNKTLESVYKSCKEIYYPINNHSKLHKYYPENININMMKPILRNLLQIMSPTPEDMSTELLASNLNYCINKAAKFAQIKERPRDLTPDAYSISNDISISKNLQIKYYEVSI